VLHLELKIFYYVHIFNFLMQQLSYIFYITQSKLKNSLIYIIHTSYASMCYNVLKSYLLLNYIILYAS